MKFFTLRVNSALLLIVGYRLKFYAGRFTCLLSWAQRCTAQQGKLVAISLLARLEAQTNEFCF